MYLKLYLKMDLFLEYLLPVGISLMKALAKVFSAH